MPHRFSVVAGVLVVSASLVAWQTTPSADRPPSQLLYTSAAEYSPLSWMQGGERFPRGATVFTGDGNSRRPLVPGFYATADANVSFDGEQVLFSGKREASKPWQVWEMSVSTGKLRRLTRCTDDCIRPLHLPADHFVYAHKLDGRFVLEVAPLAGGTNDPLLVTYAPGNFLPADVLQDGRILFQAAHTENGKTAAELYAVYSDGSGVEAYRCDHRAARYSGKQLSSGDVVFTRDGTLARFTSALAHDVPIAAPAGTYAGDVAETPDGAWLLSWQGSAGANFELTRWEPGTPALQPLVTERNANVIQPVWLASRPVPNRFPSALHEWTYSNVLCLNAYTSKYPFQNSSISAVRLYTHEANGEVQILGTTPVEKDGSFYLRVPGDRPLQIELLDNSGKTLKREAGWFWMRKGEQRICVGCHAGPETSPENAVPEVLRRSTIAVDMTVGSGHATPGGH